MKVEIDINVAITSSQIMTCCDTRNNVCHESTDINNIPEIRGNMNKFLRKLKYCSQDMHNQAIYMVLF